MLGPGFQAVDFEHSVELAAEAAAQVPSRFPFLYESGSHQSMNHIVELSYTHFTFRNPVFPCLYGQPCWLCLLHFAPEAMGFSGEKIALPEHAPEEVTCRRW